ncbi:MAG: hypothetical protein CLLPBCKN_002015 [Chroococcidiopsis cubana SAG 39.79]|nr:hypothetical protein [Chroococcidiopsis cubana SAG 39.79]
MRESGIGSREILSKNYQLPITNYQLPITVAGQRRTYTELSPLPLAAAPC